MPERKATSFEFNGSTLVISIDPNKDGQSLVKVEIDLAEIPDEVVAMLGSKKA